MRFLRWLRDLPLALLVAFEIMRFYRNNPDWQAEEGEEDGTE